MQSVRMFDQVSLALKNNNKAYLLQTYDELSGKYLQQSFSVPQRKLLSIRGQFFESFLPKENFTEDAITAITLRSKADGNCLYSSVSLMLCGDNSLVDILRVLTSIELFLFCKFYADHRYFDFVLKKGRGIQCFSSALRFSCSHESLDGSVSNEDLVCKEAIRNCCDKVFSPFLCILGLSSVIRQGIICISTRTAKDRERLLFNGRIDPRICDNGQVNEQIRILFCPSSFASFKSNHYVPVLFVESTSLKRKVTLPTKPFKKTHLDCSKLQSKISFPSLPSSISTPFVDSVSVSTSDVDSSCSSKSLFLSSVTGAFSTSTVTSLSSNVGSFSSSKLPVPSFSSSEVSFSSTSEVDSSFTHTSFSSSCISTSVSKTSVCNDFDVATFRQKVPSSSSDVPFSSSSEEDSSFTHTSFLCTPCISTSVSKTSVCTDFDVASFRQKVKTLQYSGVCELVQNVFKPDSSYTFPKSKFGAVNRIFRLEWLDSFKWLAYSPSLDGAFCLSCVLFGHKFPSKTNKIKKLFSEPFRHWPNAVNSFKKHQDCVLSGMHKDTYPLLVAMVSNLSGKSQPVDVLIDSNKRKRIVENRKRLVPIVDCIIFCGRQNISLRGHSDNVRQQGEVDEYSAESVGNFAELLTLRVRGNDTDLKEHLTNCSKNARYTSPTIQNDLIKCCGDVILEQIISEIQHNKFFSILADEATDCANKEQLSLIVRFVDSNYNIRETFLSFIHCQWGVSGEDLYKTVLDALDHLGLDVNNCRGQGYDGAGAVSGHVKGLSARILKINPKAIYVHCRSHCLNLVISKSCTVPLVRNAFGVIKELSYFFNLSPERQKFLVNNVKKVCPDSSKTKLLDVCRTRWVARIDGLHVFQELFAAIYNTLDDMDQHVIKCNLETSAKAHSFLNNILAFEFGVTLIITRNILDVTLPATKLLQERGIDIVDGINLIDAMIGKFSVMRERVDEYHTQWYSEAVSFCQKFDIQEHVKRRAMKQTMRENVPAESASEYFKRVLTIPLLDYIISELASRFNNDSVSVYNGLCIVPAKMLDMISKSVDWKEKFYSFISQYEDDLPNFLALAGELELWEQYWIKQKENIPNNIAETLKSTNLKYFQNLDIALRILGTIPVTTCECERSFSEMRRLKHYSRSTMLEERLNGLALMHVHKDIMPDIEKVIDKFAKGRRLDFL